MEDNDILEFEAVDPFRKIKEITTTDIFMNNLAREIKNCLYKENISDKDYMTILADSSPKKNKIGKIKNLSIMHSKVFESTKIVLSKSFAKRQNYFIDRDPLNLKVEELFNPQFKNNYITINFEDLKTVFQISKMKNAYGGYNYEYIVFLANDLTPHLCFYTMEGKEPRIFISCAKITQECSYYKKINIADFSEHCCKTPRTAHVCDYVLDNKGDFHTDLVLKYMFIAKDVSMELNKLGKKRNNIKKVENTNIDDNGTNNYENSVYKSEFINIYVPKKNIEVFERSYKVKTTRKKGGTMPEHEREGHTRTYRNKDGSIKKVITIEKTTVNKGKEKKNYYIK